MSNMKESFAKITATAGLLSLMLFSPQAFSKGDKSLKDRQKDPAKMEKMIERYSEENMKSRLENLETLKKAHHEHIDELYILKRKHLEELSGLRAGVDFKDEKQRGDFAIKFKAKLKELKKQERELVHKFHKEKLGKLDDHYKGKMKDRKKGFKKEFKKENE